MLWNFLEPHTQSTTLTKTEPPKAHTSLCHAQRVRRNRVSMRFAATLLATCSSVLFAQSYVPPIVTTATTTLYTGTGSISPGQVAIDKAGNVFYVDHTSSTLYEIPATSPSVVTATPVPLITGIGQYNSDGLFVDPKGNLWIANGNGSATIGGSTAYIGFVEVPAGANNIPNTASITSTNNTVTSIGATSCTATSTVPCIWNDNAFAQNITGYYAQPSALTVDASGNVYFADYNSGKIIKFNTATPGTGTLLATTAKANNASTLALDGGNNLYYCDSASTVYGAGGTGKVSLVAAGALTTVGTTATLTSALINSCAGVAADPYGNIYISGASAASSQQISEVPFEGTAINFLDEFGVISGLTNSLTYGGNLDANGNFYYATSTSVVQVQINGYNFGKVNVGSIVSSTAPTLSVYFNSAVTAVNSYFPTGSPTTNATALYLQSFPWSGTKSFGGGVAQAIGSVGTITMNFQPIHPGLLLGSFTPRTNGVDDGVVNLQGTGIGPMPIFFPGTPSLLFNAAVTNKTLNAPQGIAIDTYGDIFLADTGNGKVVADCLATTTQSEDGTGGNTSNSFCSLSTYTNAITQLGTGFVSPVAIAIDGAQDLYVLDSAATGIPVTFINGQSIASSTLVPATATFGGSVLSGPMGIAIDGYTNLYIADTGNNRIVKAHQYGATAVNNVVYVPNTTTFGGTKLSGPTGLAVDAAQNLYIADTGNNRVVEYSATGVTSVIATGSVTLNAPYSVAVYPSGQLVVSDKTNGVVFVNGTSSAVLSFGTAYTTTSAKGVALDATGNIYLSNTGGSQVLELNVTTPQAITYPNTNDLATSPLNTENVDDAGNASLIFTGLTSSSTNFGIDSTSTCSATSTVAAAASCTIVSKFTPQSVGPLTGSITLTDNQLGYTLNTTASNETANFGTSGTQALNLSGTATSAGAPQTITFPQPASPITYTTAPITLTATATSGLTVTFSVISSPGTVNGNQLTVTGVGSIVVAADQPGSLSYSAAPEVQRTIVVTQASQTITFAPTTPVTYTTTPITLTASTTSGLAVTFTLVSGPATLSGSTLTITGLGTVVVSASQSGSANYTAAPTVTQSIVINPIGTVTTPLLSLVPGTYNAAHVPALTISESTPGATIYYTLDGSTPTTASSIYTATTSIILTGTETVKAIGVLQGYATSAIASGTYVIDTAAEALPFTLTPNALTLHVGQSGTINITVTPQNGINTTISFSCSGLPIGATCSFSPSTATTGPSQATVATVLTVTAPTTIAAVQHRSNPLLPETTLAIALCMLGWCKRRSARIGLLVAAAALCLGMITGCGSSTGNQTSVVTVAIAGDSVRDTPTFTLVVEP